MDLVLEKTICVALSLAILANALIVRRLAGSWILPAVIYSLFWFLYTFIPLMGLLWIPTNPWALAYIAASSVMFSLGAVGNDWSRLYRRSDEVKRTGPDAFDTYFLEIAFWVAFAGAVVCLIANSITQGFTLDRLTGNLYESAAEYTEMRYGQDIVENIYLQLSSVLAYLCASLGGLIAASKPKSFRKAMVTLCSFLPALFVMLTQSAKGMLFLCIAVFYGGVLVVRLQRGARSIIDKRTLLYAGLLAVAIVPAVTVSFLSRGLVHIQNMSVLYDRLLSYYASYTSGHLFAFCDWFSAEIGQDSILLYAPTHLEGGFYTFMAIFHALGDDRYVPMGVYQEYYSYYPYLQSNIYTYFRGLITDFGIFGSMLVTLIASAVVHGTFRTMLVAAVPGFSAATFILFFGYVYQSFIISSLIWNSLIVMWLMLGVLLSASSYLQRSRTPSAGRSLSSAVR